MRRPALQEMLKACQDKQATVILVTDTDRLARNTFDHLQIKQLLKKEGVDLIAINQPMIDDSPEGNLIDTILAASNAFQSQITGRKTSKVMEQKAEAGWYPGGTPVLGYRNADNPNYTSNLDKRIIVIDEEVSHHVKEMFALYAEGKTSTSTIAAELNSRGIKSPQKSKIHNSLVARTLQNPFYIGSFWWNGKLYTGKHQPIITESLFNQVQKVLEDHRQGATRVRKHKMLLRGLLFYVDSSKQMWGEVRVRDGKQYDYYFCHHTGQGSYVPASDMEKQVSDIVQTIQISEGYRQEILKLAEKILTETRDSRDEERTRLEKDRAKYQKAISEAEDDRYIRHTISSEALMNIVEKYRPLLEKVSKDLASLDVDHSAKIIALDRILMLAENIGQTYLDANPTLKREYLTLFFKKFWAKEGKITKY
jgi:DNA invertase Pin-like site-specific DNA recombinase